jgi:hypothetical protein
MKYKIIFRFNASLNVRKAKKWYKNQRNGLEKEFAFEVKEAIIGLQIYPEAFAIRYKNIRIIHPRKFPYSIHFYIDSAQGQIVITNIIHDSRDFQAE